MLIQLPDARHLSDEALETIRLRALHGLELGFSELELGQLLGVRNEMISRWRTSYGSTLQHFLACYYLLFYVSKFDMLSPLKFDAISFRGN